VNTDQQLIKFVGFGRRTVDCKLSGYPIPRTPGRSAFKKEAASSAAYCGSSLFKPASHFGLSPYSNTVKPVVFPRMREARDQTRADRINDPYEHVRRGFDVGKVPTSDFQQHSITSSTGRHISGTRIWVDSLV
jgi:hypothetical protein